MPCKALRYFKITRISYYSVLYSDNNIMVGVLIASGLHTSAISSMDFYVDLRLPPCQEFDTLYALSGRLLLLLSGRNWKLHK